MGVVVGCYIFLNRWSLVGKAEERGDDTCEANDIQLGTEDQGRDGGKVKAPFFYFSLPNPQDHPPWRGGVGRGRSRDFLVAFSNVAPVLLLQCCCCSPLHVSWNGEGRLPWVVVVGGSDWERGWWNKPTERVVGRCRASHHTTMWSARSFPTAWWRRFSSSSTSCGHQLVRFLFLPLLLCLGSGPVSSVQTPLILTSPTDWAKTQ
jgi:hypothetical protein